MSTSALPRILLFAVLHFMLLFSCGLVNAQDRVSDSLRTRLKTEGRTTTRVDLLFSLAWRASDDSSSDRLWKESQTLAKELGYEKGLAYGPMIAALHFMREKDHPHALEAFKRSIAMMDSLRMPQGMESPLGDIRSVFNSTGEQEERRIFYEQALQRYQHMGLRLNEGTCHHGLGGYYLITNQYALAVEHYLKAREIFLELEPRTANNETLVVGWAYLQWGNLDRAEELLDEAYQDFEQDRNYLQAGGALTSLGELELQRGDTLKAQSLFRKAFSLMPNEANTVRAIVLTHIIQTSIWAGEMDSARIQLDRLNAQQASQPLPFSSTDGQCEVDYCNYLYWKKVGDKSAAQGYLEHALQEALRSADLGMVLKYRKELASLYRSHGDEAQAAEQALAYMHVNDSLQAAADRGSIAAYEGVVQERKSALEIQAQKASIQQQRIVMFSIAGGLLLVLALGFSIYRGKKRSDELLLNILPKEVAEELKMRGEAEAVQIDQVTVLFTDFKGFTAMSEQLTPKQLVKDLHECFSAFDAIAEKYGIEKIKTIGDAYMAAGGLPTPNTTHATDVVRAALEMRDFIAEGKARKVAAGLPYFEIRIGVHTGPVVAGIVGVKKFQYDIWGDTVNTASRMESSGEVGNVNISEATYALVKTEPGLTFSPRGKVQAKGKGEMEMYFVNATVPMTQE